MSLLVFLGGGLVSLLRETVEVWRNAEQRGRLYEQGRAILEIVAADLRSMVVRAEAGSTTIWNRLVADPDPAGFQRVRFVRTIGSEAADPNLREGGQLLTPRSPAVYRGRPLPPDEAARLRAPSGLLEVAYLYDPRPEADRIWRAVRSPIGGGSSLFVDKNIEPNPTPKEAKIKKRRGRKKRAPEPFFLEAIANPVGEGVLFLGMRFWGPTTNTWEDTPPLVRPSAKKSGPLLWWDSTRALFSSPGDSKEFTWRMRPGSLNDPSDDLYPEFVEVELVLRGPETGLLPLRLTEPVSAKGGRVVLNRTPNLGPGTNLLRIDDEWIAVRPSESNTLVVEKDGRGKRGTRAASHKKGAPVDTGVTFRRVVAVPSYRRAIEERSDSERRGRNRTRTRRRR